MAGVCKGNEARFRDFRGKKEGRKRDIEREKGLGWKDKKEKEGHKNLRKGGEELRERGCDLGREN